jgi:hypothetical protein
MSSVSIQPSSGGAGVFTIATPTTSTNYTLNLPAENGTLLTSASSSNIGSKIQSIGATASSGVLTVTLNPTLLDFRSTTLTNGSATTVSLAAQASLTIAATDSFGLVTAYGNQRIAILAINNAGTIELAASALYGGVSLDETGVITTAATATTATAIKASAVRTGVAYRVIGFVDATFTTAVGWGSPTLIQGQGGEALSAMSSLGYGQTWQSVTGSRAAGTTYYNTTGKPIIVSFNIATSGSSAVGSFAVGGINA